MDDDELAAIARWAGMYREFRDLLHSGRVVNADLADQATSLSGIVAQDGSAALFTWSRFATSAAGQAGRVRFPGLDAHAAYSVRIREDLGSASRHGGDPVWVTTALAGAIEVPGVVLSTVGVPLPTLNAQQAMLIEIRRTDS